MKVRRDNDILRPMPQPVIVAFAISLTLFLVGGTLWILDWSKVFAVIFAIGGVFSLVHAFEVLSSSIALHASGLEIRWIRGRNSLTKEEIESVTHEAGRTLLKLRSGDYIRIPDLGNAQSVAQCIKSWLKK